MSDPSDLSDPSDPTDPSDPSDLCCFNIGDSLETELLDADFSHTVLLDLSGDGRRELVGDFPVMRDLEVSQSLLAERF